MAMVEFVLSKLDEHTDEHWRTLYGTSEDSHLSFLSSSLSFSPFTTHLFTTLSLSLWCCCRLSLQWSNLVLHYNCPHHHQLCFICVHKLVTDWVCLCLCVYSRRTQTYINSPFLFARFSFLSFSRVGHFFSMASSRFVRMQMRSHIFSVVTCCGAQPYLLQCCSRGRWCWWWCWMSKDNGHMC